MQNKLTLTQGVAAFSPVLSPAVTGRLTMR
jgi:hypothetical protein